MNNTVYVIVVGPTDIKSPDPSLTTAAMRLVHTALREVIPDAAEIICGTGRRHLDVKTILNLEEVTYCSLCGCADIFIPHLDDDECEVMLANGTKVPSSQYSWPDTQSFLNCLNNGTLLIADNTFLEGLGYLTAQGGMLVEIDNCFSNDFPQTSHPTFRVMFDPNKKSEDIGIY
jgi:hypothetical protein